MRVNTRYINFIKAGYIRLHDRVVKETRRAVIVWHIRPKLNETSRLDEVSFICLFFVVILVFVCFVASDVLTTICHLAIVNVCVIIILSICNTQISILLLCFLYLFVELMITMNE